MNGTTFTVPVENRYLEDYEPGSDYEFGAVKIEEADIIIFQHTPWKWDKRSI